MEKTAQIGVWIPNGTPQRKYLKGILKKYKKKNYIDDFLDVIKKSIISSRVAKGSNKCFDDTCFDPKSFHRLSVDPTSKWRTSHIWKWFTNRVHEVVDKKIFELFPDNKYKRSECFRKTIRSGNLAWVKLHS